MAEVAEKYQYVISSDRSVQKEVIELKRHIRSKLNVQLKMKAGYSQMQVCAASLSALIQTFKCTVAASLHTHKRAVASRFAGDFREGSGESRTVSAQIVPSEIAILLCYRFS